MNHNVKEIIDALFYPVYLLKKKVPWSLGYYTAKKKSILKAVRKGYFAPGGNIPKGYGFGMDERVVEYPWVISRLPDTKEQVMLDAGSAFNWKHLLKLNPIKHASLTICTLAPEKRCYWNQGISYVYDDLRDLKFKDNSFDVIVSISTIEHIGLDNTILYTRDEAKCENKHDDYLKAVIEFKRLMKKGGSCFITVPFGQKKNHSWFQVFDESMIRQVVEAFKPCDYIVEYYGYGKSGWQKSDNNDLKNAEYFDINKNGDIAEDRAAGARGVACIRLTA